MLWHPALELGVVVVVGRAEAQGRAVLEAVKVVRQAPGPAAARPEVEERSVAAVALGEAAADQVEVYRITQFLPRSNLQFFRRRPFNEFVLLQFESSRRSEVCEHASPKYYFGV
jgi:hypothetical protein